MVQPEFVPTCTVIAGPNGSGKSTVFRELNPPGEMVNADDFARRISPQRPEAASTAAGREVLLRLSQLISQKQNFSYETTLSSNQAVGLMQKARASGFRVELVFVLLRSPELNVARVKQRVALGGHDIPTETILRRYEKTFGKLATAIRIAHQVIVYDNTEEELATLLRMDGMAIEYNGLDEAQALHVRLADTVAEALTISSDAVFRAAD